jgi:hypothetical protein
MWIFFRVAQDKKGLRRAKILNIRPLGKNQFHMCYQEVTVSDGFA